MAIQSRTLELSITQVPATPTTSAAPLSWTTVLSAVETSAGNNQAAPELRSTANSVDVANVVPFPASM